MKPNRILQHIDNRIIDFILMDYTWQDIIFYLKSNVKRYKKSEHYIQVSETYLVRNWDSIDRMKRSKTALLIFSLRRISDIKWLIKNEDKFDYDMEKKYRLILLKDKLTYNSESSSGLSN